jgi:hypothetical protein
MQTVKRSFELQPATRKSVPVWFGVFGVAGSGKTRSALRVATGIQRITGGKIAVIDSEAGRALHYAPTVQGKAEQGKYTFEHCPFAAPFGPLDYLAAVEHCVAQGAKIIVIDSMSHEHEGPGGLLEMHDTETKRLAALWRTSESAAQMAGWIEPKRQRQRAINSMLQLGAHLIFCFRAQEKTKPPPKGERDVIKLGFMPIAGPAWVYEMTACCMLYPGAGGVPTWASREIGEHMMIKRPDYLSEVIGIEGPLSEAHGEALAKWAAGGAATAGATLKDPDVAEMRAAFDAARTPQQIEAVATEWGPRFPKEDRKRRPAFVRAYTDAKARAEGATSAPPKPPSNPGERPPTVPPPHPEDFDRSA